MNRLQKILCIVLCLLIGRAAMAQGEPSENIVGNADFSAVTENVPNGWQLIQAEPGSIGGVQGQGTDRFLYLRKDSLEKENHFWWKQKLVASGGDMLQISFEAKANGEGDYWAYAGMEMYDAEGKWLDYATVRTVSMANKKYANAAVPAVKEWKAFTADLTLPQKARSVAIRLALNGNSKAEANFRNISVKKTSVKVDDVLAKQPARLPRFEISLSSVFANGVSLTPDWKLEGSEITRSATRTRVCLNGLWAIQPADESGVIPRIDDWAFFKVPGFLRKDIYSVYGQEKTSWAKRDIFAEARPLWYVRDVEVPATAYPASVYLDVSGMFANAIRVYWNGTPAGTLANQHGGRIDLSTFAKPGDKGQLAIFSLPVVPERLYAFKPDLVRTYRPGVVTQAGFHDLYLSLEPKQSYLDDVRFTPSTRRKSLRIQTPAAQSGQATNYNIKIATPDGSVVLQKDLGAGKTEGRFQTFDLPWENPHLWNPDDPYLYTAVVQANAGGRLVDESLPIKFGFREVWTEGRQLILNGNPLRLRPRLWIEYFQDGYALRRAISIYKDMGFNCIIRPSSATTDQQEDMNRWSKDEYYGITDEMGMMILSYTAYSCVSGGQFGSNTIAGDDIEKLVDYVEKYQIGPLHNHPSVIAYSGFGDQPTKGINYLYLNPEIWGYAPLDTQQYLDRLPNDAALRDRIVTKAQSGRRFIEGIKKADPSRPFLAHSDTGLGDGWGIFDYFNWTPLQEWEDWPESWSRKGIMPVGSMEHGMPYPASFLNHALANGGDCEPWVTEYAASTLGAMVYAQETKGYLDFIRSSYKPAAQNYSTLGSHGRMGQLLVTAEANYNSIWASHNKSIYRAWRTYGVPMGIEPFGPCDQFIDRNKMMEGDGKILANPAVNLKTVGAKMDRWSVQGGFWPAEAVLSYPQKPTGQAPSFLNSVGKTLHENNSALLAYIAGAAEHFTAKDHVFWSGERVQKQVAVVWDGFSPRSLQADYKVRLGDQQISAGTLPLKLTPGQILTVPFEFDAPAVQNRADGVIELTVRDIDTGKQVASDRFNFQVYAPYQASDKLRNARLALFDPTGESAGMFQRLGLNAAIVNNLNNVPACDVLVIGRRALSKLPEGKWIEQLPARVPVWILEQTDTDLEKVGLHSYPIRSRRAFVLPVASPMLKDVSESELADWRVTPALLPAGSEPLRDNYNYHTNYRGALASVTIETPTVGNFTPHLQSGFDLRETALLETSYADHRILFCQLSLPDGAGADPVATRVASNILDDLLSVPAVSARKLVVVGAEGRSALAADLGADGAKTVSPDGLSPNDVALVERLPSDPAALAQWVRDGGRAVVLPQELSLYGKYFPDLKVATREASLIAIDRLPAGSLLRGVGQNNLHWRQVLPQTFFNDQANLASVPDGRGQWVLLGFDPRALDVTAQPYLRLTQRNQYRLLSQVLTNLDADLGAPAQSMMRNIGNISPRIEITGLARMTPDMPGTDWTAPAFDDSKWNVFDLKTQETHGRAVLRLRFTPAAASAGPLALHLGTIDDYDQAFLNGVKIGEVTPANSEPEKAHLIQRHYPIPDGVLQVGKENVLAVRLWNRNADTKNWKAWLRGPISIGPAIEEKTIPLYFGPYKPSDDPYLQMHW